MKALFQGWTRSSAGNRYAFAERKATFLQPQSGSAKYVEASSIENCCDCCAGGVACSSLNLTEVPPAKRTVR